MDKNKVKELQYSQKLKEQTTYLAHLVHIIHFIYSSQVLGNQKWLNWLNITLCKLCAKKAILFSQCGCEHTPTHFISYPKC